MPYENNTGYPQSTPSFSASSECISKLFLAKGPKEFESHQLLARKPPAFPDAPHAICVLSIIEGFAPFSVR